MLPGLHVLRSGLSGFQVPSYLCCTLKGFTSKPTILERSVSTSLWYRMVNRRWLCSDSLPSSCIIEACEVVQQPLNINKQVQVHTSTRPTGNPLSYRLMLDPLSSLICGIATGRLSRILAAAQQIVSNKCRQSATVRKTCNKAYILTLYSSSILEANASACELDRAGSAILHNTLHCWSTLISIWRQRPHSRSKYQAHCMLFKRLQQRPQLTSYGEFSIRSPRSTSPKFSALGTIGSGRQ